MTVFPEPSSNVVVPGVMFPTCTVSVCSIALNPSCFDAYDVFSRYQRSRVVGSTTSHIERDFRTRSFTGYGYLGAADRGPVGSKMVP